MTLLKKLLVILLFLLIFASGLGFWVSKSPKGLPITLKKPTALPSFESHLLSKQMPIKAVGIGDSLTRGVGDPKEQGYAGIVTSTLHQSETVSTVSFHDEGITGDTTDDLLKVLKKKSVQTELSQANLIYLTIGGNDLVNVLKDNFLNLDLSLFDKQRKHYEVNLNKILSEVRALNPYASIIYLGLYNPFEDYFTTLNPTFDSIINEWNQSGKTILELYPNTLFIPTFVLFHGKTKELLYKDHFHPNPKGYHLIANRILTHFSISSQSSTLGKGSTK